LGEDPQEFEMMHRLLARAFAPRGEMERKQIHRLTQAIWRRLRLFRAQARWEKDTLMCGLSVLPAAPRLSVLRTRALAYALFGFFTKQGQLLRCEQTLDGAIERRLRALLRKRSGGDPQFKIITRESRRELEEWEEQEAQEETLRRLEEGGPEVERILEETMPDWWVKRYRRLKTAGGNAESEAEPETPAVPTDEACE
jgi:hypothetical protein